MKQGCPPISLFFEKSGITIVERAKHLPITAGVSCFLNTMNGGFFTPDGRVTDDLPLRGEIYDKLKFCAVNNIPRKITNILEVLKLEAQVPDFPPEQDRIHLSNGTLLLNGTFTEGRPAIVRNRLPVVYNPDATAPVIWLNFLDGLLYARPTM